MNHLEDDPVGTVQQWILHCNMEDKLVTICLRMVRYSETLGRQACSSRHQIVIWIRFWFTFCQTQQNYQQIVRRQSYLTLGTLVTGWAVCLRVEKDIGSICLTLLQCVFSPWWQAELCAWGWSPLAPLSTHSSSGWSDTQPAPRILWSPGKVFIGAYGPLRPSVRCQLKQYCGHP